MTIDRLVILNYPDIYTITLKNIINKSNIHREFWGFIAPSDASVAPPL